MTASPETRPDVSSRAAMTIEASIQRRVERSSIPMIKSSGNVSPERIATLTTTQCETGTLGNVSCSALPEKYISAGGGCSKSFEPTSAAPQAFSFGANNEARARKDREAQQRTAEQGRKMTAQIDERRRIDACRAEYQFQIDQLQVLMQAGSDPSRHRVELQRLQKKMNECR